MRANHEDPRTHWNAVELGLEETFIEADKLSNEGHIWVCHWPALFDVGKSFIEGHLILEDQVGETHCRTSRDTLHTVDINLALLLARFLDEAQSIVENALNLLSHVVLQMILLILELGVKVVCAIVCGAIDHVSDALLLQKL